jgi:hypothetical protein
MKQRNFHSLMPAKLTTEQFIEKAHAVHGDRYDYSEVHYVDALMTEKENRK